MEEFMDELIYSNENTCTNTNLTPLFIAQEELFQKHLLNSIKIIHNLVVDPLEMEPFIHQFSKNIRLLISLQVVSLSNFITLTNHPNFFQCKNEIRCTLDDSWHCYLDLKQAIKINLLCLTEINQSLKARIHDKFSLIELMLRQKLEMFGLHERNTRVTIIDCDCMQSDPWFGDHVTCTIIERCFS